MSQQRQHKRRTKEENARDHQRRLELKGRSPEEWVKVVKKLRPPDVRHRVACIVWWDWFGHLKKSERWAHLDYWVDSHITPEVSDERLIDGLKEAGYTETMAHWRVMKDV
jgi:hypothetical protein